MFLGGGDAVIGQRMFRVGLRADASLILECQFEDGIDMSFVCRGLLALIGKLRTRRHARTAVKRIDDAEAVIYRRISSLRMQRLDGDSFTEIFPSRMATMVSATVASRALSKCGVAGAGPGRNIAAHRAIVTSSGHLIMVWRRLMSGRVILMAIVNKYMSCLLSRRQAVHAAKQGRTSLAPSRRGWKDQVNKNLIIK